MKSFIQQLIIYGGIVIALFYVVSLGFQKTLIEQVSMVSLIFIGIITLSMALSQYSSSTNNKTQKRKLSILSGKALNSAIYYITGIALFVLYSIFLNNFVSTNKLTAQNISWNRLFDLALLVQDPILYGAIFIFSIAGAIILFIFAFSGETLLVVIKEYLIIETRVLTYINEPKLIFQIFKKKN